jgi:hypothetical protein
VSLILRMTHSENVLDTIYFKSILVKAMYRTGSRNYRFIVMFMAPRTDLLA